MNPVPRSPAPRCPGLSTGDGLRTMGGLLLHGGAVGARADSVAVPEDARALLPAPTAWDLDQGGVMTDTPPTAPGARSPGNEVHAWLELGSSRPVECSGRAFRKFVVLFPPLAQLVGVRPASRETD